MAIDDLLDEHEQSERVRSWLRKNGASILGGVVIAIGAIAGWQWYQKDQGGKLASANVEYVGFVSENRLLLASDDERPSVHLAARPGVLTAAVIGVAVR